MGGRPPAPARTRLRSYSRGLDFLRSFRDGAVKKFYSPKILSDKKSSAFPGIRSAIPRSGHPGHHARTQRGRLKELRNRCVARKFLYLWIRKTFGRVFPSKARCYYKQRVLRKVFEEWKGEWWVSQREWKLCVRADCYYRYYLYSLMFQTWRTYVHQQQSMRNKYTRAENYDAKQKMRRAWKSWLIYVVFRRTKFQMQTTALEFRQRSILWAWWSEWRRQLGQVRVGRALCASAVTHRALSLKLQAWSRWQEQLLLVQRERQKLVCAVKHRQHWQKCRCLKAWLDYLQARRVKGQQNEMAERFHHVTVLQTHFCDWQWAWQRRQSWHACHARVQALAGRVVLRRAFTHWKHYVLLCAEDTARWKGAEEHCRRRLLHFCFRALRGNVTRARLQRMRRNLAHQQHDVGLLCRFWNLWQSRIQQREEREQRPLLQAAWDHHRSEERVLTPPCAPERVQAAPAKNIATQVCQVVVTAYAEEARQGAATGQSRQALPAENPARSLPGVEETVAMAPAGERPGGQSSTLPQGDIREASICYLVAEDVSASRTPLGRENGHPSRAAAAPVQVLVHVAPAGGSTSPGAAVASSGPCPPPPGEAQDGFLHLEGERPRAQIREDGRGAGCSVPLSAAPARGLAQVEAVPDPVGRRAAEADARRPAPPAHPAAPGAAHLGGLPEPRAERPSRGGGQGEPAPEAAAAVCVTSLEGECSGLRGGSKENLSSEGSLPKGPVPQGLDPVAGGCGGADLPPAAGGLCPPGGPAGAGKGLSQDLVSALAGPGPEGSPAASPAGEGGAALPSAAPAAGPGLLESAPPGLRQEEAAAEAGHPAPGPDTQPVLLPPVAAPAGEQAAGAAGHSSGPVALGLLASGKGVGCLAGLRPGEEEEEGEAGAGGAGLPPAAPPGGRHLPPAVHSGHEGPPAAAACPAAGAGGPQPPPGSPPLCHALETEGAGPWPGASPHLHCAQQESDIQGPPSRPRQRCCWRCRPGDQEASSPSWDTGRSGQPGPGCRGPPTPGASPHKIGGVGLDDDPYPTESQAPGQPEEQALFLPSSAVRSARKQPRRPNFLLEPLQSQRPLGGGSLGGRGPETPREPDLGLAPPTGSSLTRPFSEKAQTVLVPGSALPSASGLKLVPMASTGPQLLPPSSFMPCGVGTRTEASAWVTSPGLMPQAPLSLASVPDPCLLLPEAVTGGPSSETAGVHLRSVSAWVPSIQPGPSWERGQDQVHCPVALGHSDLEAELESIQRQLQDYQSMKQSLRSYQRQASSLRRWLELSREEPRPEDQEAEQQVQEELQEVELQAQQLAAELQARRQPVSACIARVQALRRALC